MAGATVPATLVEGTPRVGLPFGLFSQVAMRPGVGERWQLGVQWETLTCEPLDGIGFAFTDDRDGVLGLPKNLDPLAASPLEASSFTVYGHFTASPAAFTPEVAQERAILHLQAREEARVEQALWTGDLDNTPSLRSALFDGAAAAQNIAVGIALLEEYNASEYGSRGLIHLTTACASIGLSEDVLESRSGRLFTNLGTPVIAGAGYDGSGPTDADPPASGERWAYITPPLFGYRSEVFTSSARPGDLLNTTKNDLYAVAERTYLLGFDACGPYATLINLGIDEGIQQ